VKPPVIGVESGFGTLVIEMGIGGLILWFVMSLAILLSAWHVVKKLKGSPWFPIAFVIFWYAGLLLLPMTFNGMQPYEDFVLNAYLWLLLGILFRLPTLAVSAQYAVMQPAMPMRRSGMI
jgi:H+/Cl- antiporter ClcA